MGQFYHVLEWFKVVEGKQFIDVKRFDDQSLFKGNQATRASFSRREKTQESYIN